MRNKSVAAYQAFSEADRAVETYASLVKRTAHHLMANLPSSVQLDDLLQAGMLGLLECLHKYDASKGASFETYARIRIRGAMIDEMRRGDWVPRSVHRNARTIAEAIRSLEHATGHPASDREVAEYLEVSVSEYHAMRFDCANSRLSSYEEIDENEETGLLPTTGADDQGFEQDARLKSVANAIDKLTERQQLVLALYYDEELNLKEIGAALGVSESRISQILSETTKKLREHNAAWNGD
ncbi:MAG: RNA polymerase sigma factor FliA [Pseudomonadota bacterium]